MEDGKALRLLGFFGAALGTEPLSFRSLRLNPSWSQGTGDWGAGSILQPKDPALARLDAISHFPSLGSEASWLGLQGSRPWKLASSEACWVLLPELLELGARIPSPAARRR